MEKVVALEEIDYGGRMRIIVGERAGGDRIRAMVDLPREASWAALSERFLELAEQCKRAAMRRGEVAQRPPEDYSSVRDMETALREAAAGRSK